MAAKPLPYLRWTLLILLLVGEILFLSLCFDASPLVHHNQWWAKILTHARLIPQLAVAIGVAILVLGGARMREELKILFRVNTRPNLFWCFLLLHSLAFFYFFHLTKIVLETDSQQSHDPGFWVALWALMGLTTGVFWVGTLIPWSLWRILSVKALGILTLAGFLGIVAWRAGQYTAELWNPLGHATLWLVRLLLIPFFDNIIWEPEHWTLGASGFNVEISWQCSGYEGIGLIWVFISFFIWYFRKELQFPQAFLLLPLGTVVIWVANAFRIAALIALGTKRPDIALAGFHSQAGWLIFNAVALGFIALARQSRFFSRSYSAETVLRERNSTVPFLAPLFVTLAAGMLVRTFSENADVYYPLLVLTQAIMLWKFRRDYFPLGWGFSWFAVSAGILAFGLWMVLAPYGESALAKPPASWQEQKSLLAGWFEVWLIFRTLGSVLTVPLVEELAFRGYFPRRLISPDFQEVPLGKFTWLSFLVSSLLFGALHTRWLAGIAVGMLYVLVLYRRGKIGDPVIAHATTNFLLVVYVLVTHDLEAWK
ncbi:MAG TPA: exosortase E/protease, VPEID-CTERM system [Gemmataceae bacterium]|nr:exosortase E/protease, VPEID-CTERM system [Gemmataceae bacterium]